METLQSALQLIKPKSYVAVLDLKDAYYSVPVAIEYRKYLRFWFEGTIYEYTCLPNGLASAPRMFTKLMKPVYATLRGSGICLVGYIDDILIVADTEEELNDHVSKTTYLLETLGFILHTAKSCPKPSMVAKFLGFIINSETMCVYMTPDKISKVTMACQSILNGTAITIRTVASVVGLMVSSFPGVYYGPLYYRSLENEKSKALKSNGWDLDDKMLLTNPTKNDIRWWVENISKDPRPITLPPIKVTLRCDSSLLGWGSVIEGTNCPTGGRWTPSEALFHINYLELKAILMGLRSLCGNMANCHIKILSDNQTAVAYIRNMGGTHSTTCNQITRDILLWCKDRNIVLTIAHLPGHLNVLADKASREFKDNIEWGLDSGCYVMLTNKWGNSQIDMFASRLNHKIDKYVSWKPDPSAYAVDAFSIDWNKFDLIYCFPPFSLIGKVLQKLQSHQTTAIIIVPQWKTQFWYPMLLKMLLEEPVAIQMSKRTLTLPHDPEKVHPLFPKLQLLGCLVSGQSFKTRALDLKQLQSF